MKAFVMKEIGRVGFMDKPVPRCAARRVERLLCVLESGRLDPTLMTTHTFSSDQMERAFGVSDKKLENVIKPLITF